MRTVIIGAGLSGLALAASLQAKGHDYLLIEARARVGGRIKTEHIGAGYFDLGPAWFWPAQPRIAALIDRLGLDKFDQYAAGDLLFEAAHGQVQRGRGFSSMEGSWRLKGGLGALTQALLDLLPAERVLLGSSVVALSNADEGITVTLGDGTAMHADQVVLALPPRIAAQIQFSPVLPRRAMQTMQEIKTWMAGQAKAVAVYETPFWRAAGLSGDATSRVGPTVEIHDASPAVGGPYGLFGFIGVPPNARRDEHDLRRQLIAQFVRIFGPDAATPLKVYIKDWALDQHTSTQADLAPLMSHPSYGLPHALRGLWDTRLIFAGTEVAAEFGGYIEGALKAAEAAFAEIDH